MDAELRHSGRKWLWKLAIALALAGLGGTTAALAGDEPPPATPDPSPFAGLAVPATLPSFAPVVERLAPTVVSISVIQRVRLGEGALVLPFFFGSPFGDGPFGGGPGGTPPEFENRGSGSGVIVDAEGLVLTNAHVVRNAGEVTVQVDGGRSYPAEVVGVDEPTDLALLRLADAGRLVAATLGDSDAVQVGDWVLAIGNPFGLEHTVTTGIVSAKERRTGGPRERYGSFLQTDASINPGNSGGPLFNLRGEVIGINTAINAAGQGIGFAIPSNMARTVLEQLRERGRVERSWLGVTIQTVTPELAESFRLAGTPRGALVSSIEADSPASRAGIRPGDIVLRFDDEEIGDAAELPWLAATAGVGRSVRLQVFRDGTKRDVSLTLGRMPEEESARVDLPAREAPEEEEPPRGLGIQVEDVPERLAPQLGDGAGALVARVDPHGAGSDYGLRPGDVIRELDGEAVADAAALQRLVRDRDKADVVRLLVRNQRGTRYVGIRLR
ncbi:MAG: Do family serine endopeptidase [Deltaproteobacteria bacterium]|nr:Do family serine endopeptidase [Deltaproteobacteria bacterium]